MKPVCIPCQRFMRPVKSGFYFTEMMPTTDGAPAGTAAPELWVPYKLWAGDAWACPDCKAEIIVGVGREPIAEHYQPDFAEYAAVSKLNVNDC